MFESLNFGKTGFKSCVFEKAFHLILMHFIHKIQCFEEFLHNFFFQKFIFLEFQSIEPALRSIEIAIKIFGQPLSISINAQSMMDQSKHFRSIEPNFRSIENRVESFLKTILPVFKLIFSKSFQLFSLST